MGFLTPYWQLDYPRADENTCPFCSGSISTLVSLVVTNASLFLVLDLQLAEAGRRCLP